MSSIPIPEPTLSTRAMLCSLSISQWSASKHLKIFPPRFQVQNLAISDDPQFSPDSPFVKAQELDVSVRLLPLMHKQVEISSLNLERPSVNLIKNSNGVWNFSTVGQTTGTGATNAHPQPGETSPTHQQQSPTGENPQAGTSTSSSEQQFSLEALTVRDGEISVLDQKTSKTPSVYDHIDVSLKNFSPNTPFDVTAAVHMAGSGEQELRLRGEGGPIVNGTPEITPFHGTLSLKQVKLSDLSKFLNSPVLNGTDGVISGDAKINSTSGKLNAQGTTQIQNAKVQGMELGFPLDARYDLTHDLSTDLLTIRDLVVKFGSTPLQVNGTINANPSPALLDFNLRANNVSIAEAAKVAASAGLALSQGTTASGNVNATIQAKGAADKLALTGTVTRTPVVLRKEVRFSREEIEGCGTCPADHFARTTGGPAALRF